MARTKARIYVGCSLTLAPEAFKRQVEEFKLSLRRAGHEVFDFIGLVNGTPKDVYEWDIGHCIRDCDVFVAICDEPSIGLGWELSEAARLGKPILAVAHNDAKVTRLLLGAAEVEPNLEFVRYASLPEILPAVEKKIAL